MKRTHAGTANLAVGLALSALGVACHGVAAYCALHTKTLEVASPVSHQPDSCQQLLVGLGFEAVRVGRELRIAKRTLENPERLLADASIGIAACRLPLVRFCMGPSCAAPAVAEGISFALSTPPN